MGFRESPAAIVGLNEVVYPALQGTQKDPEGSLTHISNIGMCVCTHHYALL